MASLLIRGSLACATVAVALLWSRPADAQVADPGGGGLVNNLITGAQYDIINKAKAERRLENVRARLADDVESGNRDAADRHARRIGLLRYRIAVDEWLIRKNSYCDTPIYPIRTDAMSCAVIAEARRPPGAPPFRRPLPSP